MYGYIIMIFIFMHYYSDAMELEEKQRCSRELYVSRKACFERYGAAIDRMVWQADTSTQPPYVAISGCIEYVKKYPLDMQKLIKDHYVGEDTLMPLYWASYRQKQQQTPFYDDDVLAFSDDGNAVFVKTLPKTIWSQNLQQPEMCKKYKEFNTWDISACAVHGREIMCVSHDTKVGYCDGEKAVVAFDEKKTITALDFQDDVFVYGTLAGRVHVKDKNFLVKLCKSFHRADVKINTVAIDGNQIVISSSNNRVYQYMYTKPKCQEIECAEGLGVTSIKIANPYILLGSWKGTVYVIDSRKNTEILHTFSIRNGYSITALGACADGSYRAGSRGVITTWQPGFDKKKEWENITLEELCVVCNICQ